MEKGTSRHKRRDGSNFGKQGDEMDPPWGGMKGLRVRSSEKVRNGGRTEKKY